MAGEVGYNDLSREDFDTRMGELTFYAFLAHGLGDHTAIDDIALQLEALSEANPGHVARLEEHAGRFGEYLRS